VITTELTTMMYDITMNVVRPALISDGMSVPRAAR